MKDDERILKRVLLPVFGAGTPVGTLGGPMIAQYERTRTGQVSAYGGERTGGAPALPAAGEALGLRGLRPRDRLPKRPEGRLRYLDEAEIGKLMAACRTSRNRYLVSVVTLALHTGMRKGEILGLEWERVDFSTARLTLVQTKSGKPRGVPIGRAVYDALLALEPDPARRQGRIFRPGNAEAGVRSAGHRGGAHAGGHRCISLP